MAKIAFELVSPERSLLEVEADMVTVPGTEGDFGVLPGHAPTISSLRPGVIRVEGAEGGERRLFVDGGIAEVTPERLTVLAEGAVPLDELDRATLEQKIRDAEEDVEDAKTDMERMRAEHQLDHLREMLKVL